VVKIIFTFLVILSLQTPAFANGIYQTAKQFISSSFNGESPKSKALWLSNDDKVAISDIMSHEYNRLRVRYWQQENETVWVLE
jgi:hypothetical protein